MEKLITAIDHVVIAVRDLPVARAQYETLTGRSFGASHSEDGAETALLTLDNISVELMAPAGAGETADRLRAALDEGGEGLKSIVFATPDIARLHRRLERVGLAPSPVQERARDGQSWRSFRLDRGRSNGVRIFCIQRELAPPPSPAAALGLDHVVVRSRDMERAAALFGARLGLDMRLDREIGERRLMFFRCGDAVVEVVRHAEGAEDGLWGLSWRVANAEAAQARLTGAGLDVSPVRTGMKPGTRVFTVRDRTCEVPTLMIEQGATRD